MLYCPHLFVRVFFFFNDTATTEIYTLSLHDALPIWNSSTCSWRWPRAIRMRRSTCAICSPARSSAASVTSRRSNGSRSEEHTSELQSLAYLVCRLLLEKKKNP